LPLIPLTLCPFVFFFAAFGNACIAEAVPVRSRRISSLSWLPFLRISSQLAVQIETLALKGAGDLTGELLFPRMGSFVVTTGFSNDSMILH